MSDRLCNLKQWETLQRVPSEEYCCETAAKEESKVTQPPIGAETAEPRDYFNLGQFDM